MNPRYITTLQKIFWVIGWSLLASAAAGIAVEAYLYFKPASDSLLQLPKREFYFLKSARLLFSAVGQAFFAFLVSAVFDMIFHRTPAQTPRNERFLALACIGFIGEGFTGILGWVKTLLYLLPHTDLSSALGMASVGTYLLGIFSSLFSFVYAATIFVLYRHFSKMINFEAEVI